MNQPNVKIEGDDLVIGLVGAIGVDLHTISQELIKNLKTVGYDPYLIRLSDVIKDMAEKFGHQVPNTFFSRSKEMMEFGNKLRKMSGHDGLLSFYGIANIKNTREKNPSSNNRAFIVRQLKRPEEVLKFRGVYGDRFILLSCYKSQKDRLGFLIKEIRNNPDSSSDKNNLDDLARSLIKKDESDIGDPNGQRLAETFPLADFILDAGSEDSISADCTRIVEILFNRPYLSPTRDEQGIYFSYAASLRSVDLSRQVGAAIFTKDGDILSIGCNEVPKGSGGQYWCDDANDKRDFKRGSDPSADARVEIVRELFETLKKHGWLSDEISNLDLATIVQRAIGEKSSPLSELSVMDLLEFGRIVHAEMAAITDAAKRGISIKGSTLFTTTFPCHMCTRHIISSGIKRVVYIEPYPKSRAMDLHSDAISVNDAESSDEKVSFEHFKGVTPQRYQHFFSHGKKRKKDDHTKIDWSPADSAFRYKTKDMMYFNSEEKELSIFSTIVDLLDTERVKLAKNKPFKVQKRKNRKMVSSPMYQRPHLRRWR